MSQVTQFVVELELQPRPSAYIRVVLLIFPLLVRRDLGVRRMGGWGCDPPRTMKFVSGVTWIHFQGFADSLPQPLSPRLQLLEVLGQTLKREGFD